MLKPRSTVEGGDESVTRRRHAQKVLPDVVLPSAATVEVAVAAASAFSTTMAVSLTVSLMVEGGGLRRGDGIRLGHFGGKKI